jgi:hypothetical protein
MMEVKTCRSKIDYYDKIILEGSGISVQKNSFSGSLSSFEKLGDFKNDKNIRKIWKRVVSGNYEVIKY